MDVCFPGFSAITGPGTVKRWERDSLTVWCRYGPGYETYKKWWCRGADWGSCKILVRTTGSEQEVKKGRVSIRDHHKYRTITVTMEALTLGDADTYWCGVEREGHDLRAQFKVTVDPAPDTPKEDKVSPTVTESRDFVTEILPVVAAVLLLVLTAASLLAWRLVRRQRKASGISPEQVRAPESELCYASLALHQSGTARKEASAQVEVQVEYIIGPSQQDITYAALSLGPLSQEPTYGNTEQLVTHIPHSSQEEPVEYSTVRRH
ncbi:CMRF35-like molecule 1 [Talpa occidentalis]|uniref:CMRF35-like molecule 1 n=1 Tax=Talpa occidentalis TaxID=50954 RepID=UPI00188E5348|nr:CMRF35-like molecule 1 [Talpa occidentalis]